MRRTALPPVVAAIFAAGIACACSVHHDGGAAAASSVPADPASIRGTVTSLGSAPQHIRVEVDPAAASGSDKAVVALGPDTRILHRDGRAAGVSDIAAGSVVSVWFTGPVRESYPVQADAGTVVVEP